MLSQYPPNQVPADALGKALADLGGGPQAVQQLQTASTAASDPVVGPKLAYVLAHGADVQAATTDPASAARLAFVAAHGPTVQAAQADAPGQWQRWFWVCLAGVVLFIPTILVLRGSWSPGRARDEELAHERAVAAELERLGLETADS